MGVRVAGGARRKKGRSCLIRNQLSLLSHPCIFPRIFYTCKYAPSESAASRNILRAALLLSSSQRDVYIKSFIREDYRRKSTTAVINLFDLP